MRHPVSHRRDAQWTQAAVRFGDHDAAHRLGSVGFVFQVLDQFPQKRVYAYAALYGVEADPVNAGAASVGSDKPPGMAEDVCPE